MTALKVIASVSIDIDNRTYKYSYKLDKEGNLVLLKIDEFDMQNIRAKVPLSRRLVSSKMANDTNLMNQFDTFCTLLEKLYDVEVIIAAADDYEDDYIGFDLLWEE